MRAGRGWRHRMRRERRNAHAARVRRVLAAAPNVERHARWEVGRHLPTAALAFDWDLGSEFPRPSFTISVRYWRTTDTRQVSRSSDGMREECATPVRVAEWTSVVNTEVPHPDYAAAEATVLAERACFALGRKIDDERGEILARDASPSRPAWERYWASLNLYAGA